MAFHFYDGNSICAKTQRRFYYIFFQRIDASLINRIGNMSDMITLIDSKQNDLAKMEEALNYNCALMKTFSDRLISVLMKGRDDSLNFNTERHKLRDLCIYLTNGYMVLLFSYHFMFATLIQLQYVWSIVTVLVNMNILFLTFLTLLDPISES